MMLVVGGIRQSDRRSSPCRGHGRRRHRSGRSRRCWSTLLELAYGRVCRMSGCHVRTPMASPLSARTLETPRLRMITFSFSLTRLLHVSLIQLPLVGTCLHSESLEDGVGVLADDGGVAANLDLVGGLLDGTVDVDDLGVIAGDSGGEGSVGRDGSGSTAGTTGGAAVQASIAERSLPMSISVGFFTGRVLTSLTVARLAWVEVAVGAARTCPDRRPAAATIHLKLVIVTRREKEWKGSWG